VTIGFQRLTGSLRTEKSFMGQRFAGSNATDKVVLPDFLW
jgi:hypothetical protein